VKHRTFKPEIYEGLKIPSSPAHEIKERVRVLNLEPKMSDEQVKAREGGFFTEKDVGEILNEDVDVYGIDSATGNKKLIARFRKHVIPNDVVKQGWEAFYQTAAASRNRGAAAGPIQLESNYWKARKPVQITGWSARYMQDGKVSKMRVNNNVYSSVLGYFEQTPFMGLPCRLTSYTQKYFDNYKHGMPFIHAIDNCFKKLIPDRHALQLKAAKEANNYRIGATAFSSVTINRNFRTGLHMDDGDFRDGYGNLSVIERGEYSGGATLFPRYGIGFNIRTGDFLAMDVHEWHCNTEMVETAAQAKANKALPRVHFEDAATGTLGGNKNFTRISFVCYLRERLRKCDKAKTQQYYDRIKFDPHNGSYAETKGTRKKKKE
jgi:hypothetical protein